MRVKAWSNGGGTYGIRIGAKNRADFFNSSWTEVSLEIDGETHVAALTPGFWRACPEVRHPAIRAWLGRHALLTWPRNHPPEAELVPVRRNVFRLVTKG